MKTELHLKIISIIIALSLLFLGLYNQQPTLAETIRTLMSLLIIIYFITIWMRAKKFLHFISSMLLPIWLIVLFNSGKITDYLFIQKRETSLHEITQFIQSDPQYEKLITYSILHLNKMPQTAHQNPTTLFSLPIPYIAKQWKEIPSLTLYQLLKKNHLIGFQLCHGSILFHINNHRQLRYYFEKSDFIYRGDQEIKPGWYQVDQFTNY